MPWHHLFFHRNPIEVYDCGNKHLAHLVSALYIIHKPDSEIDLVAESNDDMARVMGFSGFGNMKKAKQFDMSKILEDAKIQARERNATNNQALEEKAVEMAKESVKVQEAKEIKTKENSDSSDSDDDFIGPPIPKDLKDSIKPFLHVHAP